MKNSQRYIITKLTGAGQGVTIPHKPRLDSAGPAMVTLSVGFGHNFFHDLFMERRENMVMRSRPVSRPWPVFDEMSKISPGQVEKLRGYNIGKIFFDEAIL